MFNKQDMIQDPCTDEAGQLMNEMHKIQTWTKAKRAIYEELVALLEYEEGYYQIIEDLMLLKYGLWKTELILWYVFGRKDKDGEIHPLTIKIKEKDDEDVYLKSSLDLWNLLEQLEEQKLKDEESEK